MHDSNIFKLKFIKKIQMNYLVSSLRAPLKKYKAFILQYSFDSINDQNC